MIKSIARHPVLFMTIGTIVGGGMTVFVKGASVALPVFIIGGLRYLFQGLVFLSISSPWKINRKKKFYQAVAINTALAVVGVLSWLLAIERVQAINVVIGTLLMPIFVYIGSVMFLKEPSSTKAFSGSLVALVGAFLLLGEPILIGSSNIGTELWGNILILVSVVITSAGVIHAKVVYKFGDYRPFVSIRSLGVAMMLFMLATMNGQLSSLTEATAEAWTYVALLIIVAIIANIFFYASLQHMRVEDSAPILYLDPLTGVVLGILLLGEGFTTLGLIGTATIIVGVMVAHPIHTRRFLYFKSPHHEHRNGFTHWLKKEYRNLERSYKSWL